VSPRALFVATVFVCIVNGIISPSVLYVLLFAPVWAPTLFAPSGQTLFLLASLIVSTGTLLLAGVPAALYERIAGLEQSSIPSMALWLVGAILLTLPGLTTYL
jgi:hypothetical protein